MNVVLLAGNLTRDPEMRYTPSGKAVTSFTVAVNDGYGEKRTTQFIRCDAWEKVAESVAERGRKGSRVVVEGRLTVDSYTDKQTGGRREKTFVTCKSVTFAAAEVVEQAMFETRTTGRTQSQAPSEDLDDLEDLPF